MKVELEWICGSDGPEQCLTTFDTTCLIRDVTEHLQLLLRKGGYHFHTTAEKEIVRIIKEKTCYLPLNPVKEEKDIGEKKEEFMLPDGNIIKVRNGSVATNTTVMTCCLTWTVSTWNDDLH
jgi:hypothetical protein